MNYANVIIDISHEKVDRTFQYIIPEELKGSIKPGDCVNVPFGKGNSLRHSYVISISDKSEIEPERLKYIDSLSDSFNRIQSDYIKLASWMKDTYGSTMIAALKTVLPVKKPVKLKEKKKIIRKLSSEETASLYSEAIRKKHPAKARLLNELVKEEVLPYELVTGKLNVSSSTINSLFKDGVISIESESVYRNPVVPDTERDKAKELSDEQRYACDTINEKTGKYLLHGITGSGKTEVYLNIIEKTIARGQQCIMLIPEIALTYQTLLRFYKRFGDRVSVMNSTLSAGERYDQCLRAEKGDIDVIIGPRSALFVPFPNLGMVIIDEEHESTYISEQNPRYHTKETAEELCRIKNATLVLGSATPSLESYYGAKNGEYTLLRLTRRLTGGTLPDAEIVDMRNELRNGNRSMLSRRLSELIKDRLDKKEQIMLFLNKRGYSGFLNCRMCGHVIKCPHCDVSLSRHNDGRLKCHYCGYETGDVKKCPKCGSEHIRAFRVGTQQVEETVKKMFPQAYVLRMDADTTQEKDSYEKILSAFADNEADILIGTQMIVKGHDFPNVTLVGALAADLSLNDSDFRTGEKTFQLLAQAIGRAGRGEKTGLAIIQTYRPDHYSIIDAATQDYEAFFEEEISYRRLCSYPPAGCMVHVLVTSDDERRALGLATALKKRADKDVAIIGPAPDVISKVSDRFRYGIYIKGRSKESVAATRLKMEEFLDMAPLINENVTFDVL
ncbi:MAG: primosomal protein N' [Lachnospiraceae bacterium]|nr:primosomal protein N' [Lachnospiraceae bacterium]